MQSDAYSGGGLSYTQSFGYDALNRLTTSNENSGASWSQTNAYDRYGNRWIDYGGGNYNLSFSTSTNRITTSGFAYDSAGNLTNDTIHAYTFDAENKISKVDSVVAYTYDGDGQRVRKLVGENTRFVYGIGGQLVAEFDGASGSLRKEYVQGGATLITIEPTALNSNGTRYTTSDHLGSPRVVTNASASVVSRHDYMPFGEELGTGIGGRTNGMGYGVADGLRQKFTLKERDIETGLDFFEARYFSSTQGRFTSTDPVALTVERLVDPQRINLYGYCRNNPLAFIDPTGEIITFANDDARKEYEEYLKFLNSDKKKYANELATVNRLQSSEVEYRLSVGGKNFEGAEGNTTTDGQRINVAISNVGGPGGETFSLNSRFAHELEHARQFDNGEFAFYRDPKTGKWVPSRSSYDIGDEVKAWKVQLNTSTARDFWKTEGGQQKPSLLREFASAKTDDERAGVLSRTAYPNRNQHRDSNVNFPAGEGYKPGQLIRPTDRPNFFGRVYTGNK